MAEYQDMVTIPNISIILQHTLSFKQCNKVLYIFIFVKIYTHVINISSNIHNIYR